MASLRVVAPAGSNPAPSAIIEGMAWKNADLQAAARFPGPSEIKIPPLLDRDGRVAVGGAIEEVLRNAGE